MSEKLNVGVGREIITPSIGTILYGYAPGRPAQSVYDDLTVTAFAFEYGKTKAIMMTATLCLIRNDVVAKIREAVSKKTGLCTKNITISATHTHSGPNTDADSGWGKINMEYIDTILVPKCVAASEAALKDLQPALTGIGTTLSDVGVNRRQVLPDGSVTLGQNPWGPYDPVMTVIAFKNAETGKAIGNMVHYCAHNTAAGCNPEITRDWSGIMTDRLEEQTKAISAFYNGAEGDLGPRLSDGSTASCLAQAIELGNRAAVDVMRAYRTIKEWRALDLKVYTDDIKLPYKEITSKEQALAEIEKIGDIEKMPESYTKYATKNELIKWEGIVAEHESGKPFKTHMIINQTLVAIGPIVFVPFPFEMFVEMTLRLREYSPYQHTLCLSNTNGSNTYFPSHEQICRGGYEVWQFNDNIYNLVDNADDFIVNENMRLINEIVK